MSRWREWAESRYSDEVSIGEVASVELIELSNKELVYWVQHFITEVRMHARLASVSHAQFEALYHFHCRDFVCFRLIG